MNNRQIAQVNMFIRIKLFFAKYNALLVAFAPLAALISKFTTQQKALQTEIDAQGIDLTGVAKGKDGLKAAAVKLIVPLCRKAKVWAKTTGNSVLVTQFDVTKSSFGTSEVAEVALFENLMTALQANAAALLAYNISAAQIAAAGTAVTAFVNAVGTPQQSAITNQTATVAIVDAIKSINDLLIDVDDLIIPEFAATQATMVTEYESNRKIGNATATHTTITAHIYADAVHSQTIGGAIASIDELNRTVTTKADGVASIVQFKAGDYHLTIKAAGHIDAHIPFTIKTGKHLEIDVVMNDGAVQGTATTSVKAVANAKVELINTNFYAMTDSDGKYSIAGVPEGNYTMKISTEGGDVASKTVAIMSGQVVVVDWGL